MIDASGQVTGNLTLPIREGLPTNSSESQVSLPAMRSEALAFKKQDFPD
jgi:hypothetical protein